MKVIIAGSRDFNDYELLESKVSHLLSLVKPEDTEVVSGGCRGVDKLGERYAKEHGIKLRCSQLSGTPTVSQRDLGETNRWQSMEIH